MLWFKKKTVSPETKKFINKEVKEFEEKVSNYMEHMESLCDRDVDYQFLYELFLNVAKGTPDLRCEVTLKNGEKLSIWKQPEVKVNKGW